MPSNSIITTGGKYSTSRMLIDYTNDYYMPLCNLTNKYYSNVDNVAEYNNWKNDLFNNWKDIKITQTNNLDNIFNLLPLYLRNSEAENKKMNEKQ